MAQWYKRDETKLIDCIRPHETDFKFNDEHFFTNAEHRGVTQATEQQALAHTSYLCTEEMNSSFHKLERIAVFLCIFALWNFVSLKCTYLRTDTAISRAQKIHEDLYQAKQWKSWVQQSHWNSFTHREIRTRLKETTNKRLSLLFRFFLITSFWDLGIHKSQINISHVVLLSVTSSPCQNFCPTCDEIQGKGNLSL